MGCGATWCPLGATNYFQPLYWGIFVFPSLWHWSSLPIGTEATITRVVHFNEGSNYSPMQLDLDILEEARERATVRSALYQQALRRYHQRSVRSRAFNVGDLVLRRVQTTENRNKLSPQWECPYVVSQVLRPGAYRLSTEDGHAVQKSWNIDQLHRFYT